MNLPSSTVALTVYMLTQALNNEIKKTTEEKKKK